MGCKGTHANQASQKEQNLLRSRQFPKSRKSISIKKIKLTFN